MYDLEMIVIKVSKGVPYIWNPEGEVIKYNNHYIILDYVNCH